MSPGYEKLSRKLPVSSQVYDDLAAPRGASTGSTIQRRSNERRKIIFACLINNSDYFGRYNPSWMIKYGRTMEDTVTLFGNAYIQFNTLLADWCFCITKI